MNTQLSVNCAALWHKLSPKRRKPKIDKAGKGGRLWKRRSEKGITKYVTRNEIVIRIVKIFEGR